MMCAKSLIKLYYNLKLRQKIIILFMISVVIPVIVIMQLIIMESTNNIIEQTVLNQDDSVAQVKMAIENEFFRNASFCSSVVQDVSLQKVLSPIMKYRVVDNVDLYRNYLNAYVTDAIFSGTNFIIYFQNANIMQDYKTFKYADDQVTAYKEYRDALSNKGKLTVGYDKDGDKVFMSETIKDIFNGTAGVVSVWTAGEKLKSLMGGNLGDLGALILCSGDGEMVAVDTGVEKMGIDVQDIIRKSGGKNEPLDYQSSGNLYKIIIKNVHVTGNLAEWKLVKAVPMGDILSGAFTMRNRWFMISATVMLASCLLFALVIGFITKKMNTLAKYMQGVANGKFDAMEDMRSRDEIGTMTVGYNYMVGELKTLIHDNYEKNLRLSEAVVKKQQAELFALQSQIHPHFLFNTLESIGMKIRAQQAKKAEEMLLHLAKLLRKSISWGGEIVTLGEELDFTLDYLEIQKLRQGSRLSYLVQCPDALKSSMIPKLILQPIVENAIVHGTENKIDDGHVSVRIEAEGGELSITVEDDGVGITPEKLSSIQEEISQTEPYAASRHIGLSNIHNRLRARYGSSFIFEIVSAAGAGTTVRIRLPEEGGESDAQSAGR